MAFIMKLAIIGLMLSAGVAAAYDLPVRKLEAAVAKFQDRLPQADEAPAPVRPTRAKGDRLSGPGACAPRPPIAVTCVAVEERASRLDAAG